MEHNVHRDPPFSSRRDIDAMVPPWERAKPETMCDARIFTVQRVPSVSGATGKSFDFIRLQARNWVNVVALTPEEELIMVVQQRHGIDRATLEIPAGLLDPGEEPAAAARRELEEETGYVPDELIHIGTVWPNPAFLDNLCYTYLALSCRARGVVNRDPLEEIEVVLLPRERLPELMVRGLLGNALGITGLAWYGLYREGHRWSGDANIES